MFKRIKHSKDDLHIAQCNFAVRMLSLQNVPNTQLLKDKLVTGYYLDHLLTIMHKKGSIVLPDNEIYTLDKLKADLINQYEMMKITQYIDISNTLTISNSVEMHCDIDPVCGLKHLKFYKNL